LEFRFWPLFWDSDFGQKIWDSDFGQKIFGIQILVKNANFSTGFSRNSPNQGVQQKDQLF